MTPSVYDQPVRNLHPIVEGFYLLQDLDVAMMEYTNRATVGRLQYGWHWKPADYMDFVKWREALASRKREYEQDLADLFLDYLYRAALGEARHAPKQCGWGYKEIDPGKSRSDVVRLADHWDPKDTLEQLVELFGRERWGSAYGGKKWKHICESALLYWSLPPAAFVDHVVDLSHNGGLCFDKGFLINVGYQLSYTELLDKKREGSLLAWHHSCAVDPSIITLVTTAHKHGWLHAECRFEETEAFHYHPLPFGTQTLGELEKMTLADCGCCGRACSNCEKCEDCCECVRCPSCEDKKSSTCSTCDCCESCCACWWCEGCHETQNTEVVKCGNCERCENCCECALCEECEEMCNELVSCCEKCEGCCECFTCEKCGEKFEETCDDCNQCSTGCKCAVDENQLSLIPEETEAA